MSLLKVSSLALCWQESRGGGVGGLRKFVYPPQDSEDVLLRASNWRRKQVIWRMLTGCQGRKNPPTGLLQCGATWLPSRDSSSPAVLGVA